MFSSSACIPLSRGLYAIVDAADYEWLSQWKWCALRSRYAIRWSRCDGKLHQIQMHSLIAGPGSGQETDHRNHNTLDNRRANLRIVSHTQNLWNQRLRTDSTTGFKGVSLNRGKFMAYITFNRRTKNLGRFDTPEAAAAAYDAAALRLFGPFAFTNTELAKKDLTTTEIQNETN